MQDDTHILGGASPFPETSWTLLARARDLESPDYQASLDRLFRGYWGPVYFYIRRNWAATNEAAKDLTQEYFLRFLEGSFLRDVSAEKGRFRNFVLITLRRFLSKQRRADRALKRRPEKGLLSLDEMVADHSHFDFLPAEHEDPGQQFDEDWRTALFEAALARLRRLAVQCNRAYCVDILERYDLAPRDEDEKLTYGDLAREMDLPAHKVRKGLAWAREQFRAMTIEELRDLVTDESSLREEALHLFGTEL